jgi:hypothetical protein
VQEIRTNIYYSTYMGDAANVTRAVQHKVLSTQNMTT